MTSIHSSHAAENTTVDHLEKLRVSTQQSLSPQQLYAAQPVKALWPQQYGSRIFGLGLLTLLAAGAALFASDYWLSAILIPFLILALAGLGQNILTGYTGLLSLGSAAFMAIGAFSAYNLNLRIPQLPLLLSIALGGGIAALFGVLAGLPSLRIRGFYLIVSTLALQFFVLWVLTQFPWFSNYSTSGVITAPALSLFGYSLDSPAGRYVYNLLIVVVLTYIAHRLLNTRLGRNFKAVRDMETAAAASGIAVFQTKLWAFAISSFYLGIAGSLWAFTYLGTVEPNGFDLTRSFQVLFIVLLGGLGSLAGSYFGAAFIVLFPIALSQGARLLFGNSIDGAALENIQKIIFGGLIIWFLIREPEGLARLWQRIYQRIKIWPLRF
jgi:branched-chain amino acid transport system permease protein